MRQITDIAEKNYIFSNMLDYFYIFNSKNKNGINFTENELFAHGYYSDGIQLIRDNLDKIEVYISDKIHLGMFDRTRIVYITIDEELEAQFGLMLL